MEASRRELLAAAVITLVIGLYDVSDRVRRKRDDYATQVRKLVAETEEEQSVISQSSRIDVVLSHERR